MAWSTIRRATDTDVERLEDAAARFCERHNIDVEGHDSAVQAVEYETQCWPSDSFEIREHTKRMGRLWRRIVRRMLGDNSAEGIACGHVGYHVD